MGGNVQFGIDKAWYIVVCYPFKVLLWKPLNLFYSGLFNVLGDR